MWLAQTWRFFLSAGPVPEGESEVYKPPQIGFQQPLCPDRKLVTNAQDRNLSQKRKEAERPGKSLQGKEKMQSAALVFSLEAEPRSAELQGLRNRRGTWGGGPGPSPPSSPDVAWSVRSPFQSPPSPQFLFLEARGSRMDGEASPARGHCPATRGVSCEEAQWERGPGWAGVALHPVQEMWVAGPMGPSLQPCLVS